MPGYMLLCRGVDTTNLAMSCLYILSELMGAVKRTRLSGERGTYTSLSKEKMLLTFIQPLVREDYRQHLEECGESHEDASYKAKDFGRAELRLERSEEGDRVKERSHRDHDSGDNMGCCEGFICKEMSQQS